MITLHLVQEGDTLDSIAKMYNIPLSRLMLENDIEYYRDLNVGQIINIFYPIETYVVKKDDTIPSILSQFNITLLQLLQNNPQLNLKDGLKEGEQLVIRYESDEELEDLEVNGMCYSFIDINILRRTLPYLTYITVMDYVVDFSGQLSDVDDEFVLSLAKAYGTVPFMLVSSQNPTGVGCYDMTALLLSDLVAQERLLNKIIEVAKAKGYEGVVFGFQYISERTVGDYIKFIDYATTRLHNEGLLSWEVVIPKFLVSEQFQLEVNKDIDGVILLAYQWANTFVPTTSQTSYQYKRETLIKLLESVDPSKISLGISRIAYDFELPFVEGQSFVSTLTDPRAISLANQYNSVIQYDEEARYSYYNYFLNDIEHVVLFQDPRYYVSILDLVDEFNLGGVSIWNIMYFSRIWFIINTTSNIIKLLPVNDEAILEGLK